MDELRSDMGSAFCSEVMKQLCQNLNVVQKFGADHAPCSQGQVENAVRSMKRILERSTLNDLSALPLVQRAINTSLKNPSIKRQVPISAEVLLYGEETKGPLDSLVSPLSNVVQSPIDEKELSECVKKFGEAWAMEVGQVRAQRVDRLNDNECPDLSEGDSVFRVFQDGLGRSKSSGPYLIEAINDNRVKLHGISTNVPIHQLRLCTNEDGKLGHTLNPPDPHNLIPMGRHNIPTKSIVMFITPEWDADDNEEVWSYDIGVVEANASPAMTIHHRIAHSTGICSPHGMTTKADKDCVEKDDIGPMDMVGYDGGPEETTSTWRTEVGAIVDYPYIRTTNACVTTIGAIEGLDKETSPEALMECVHSWLSRFGSQGVILLDGPECRTAWNGIPTVLGEVRTPEGKVVRALKGLPDVPSGEYSRLGVNVVMALRFAMAYASRVNRPLTKVVNVEGVMDTPCLPTSTYEGVIQPYGSASQGLGSREAALSSYGSITSNLTSQGDVLANATCGLEYGMAYPTDLEGDTVTRVSEALEGGRYYHAYPDQRVLSGTLQLRKPLDFMLRSTGGSGRTIKVCLTSMGSSRAIKAANEERPHVCSAGSPGGVDRASFRSMVLIEAPCGLRVEVGIVEDPETVTTPLLPCLIEDVIPTVRCNSKGEQVVSKVNEPLTIGGNDSSSLKDSESHDAIEISGRNGEITSNVGGMPMVGAINMATYDTAAIPVTPNPKPLYCYTLSINKGTPEDPLPNSASAGYDLHDTILLPFGPELNNDILDSNGGSSSSCYDKERVDETHKDDRVPEHKKVELPPKDTPKMDDLKGMRDAKEDYVSLEASGDESTGKHIRDRCHKERVNSTKSYRSKGSTVSNTKTASKNGHFPADEASELGSLMAYATPDGRYDGELLNDEGFEETVTVCARRCQMVDGELCQFRLYLVGDIAKAQLGLKSTTLERLGRICYVDRDGLVHRRPSSMDESDRLYGKGVLYLGESDYSSCMVRILAVIYHYIYGHLGGPRVYGKLTLRFWRKGLKRLVKGTIGSCVSCLKARASRRLDYVTTHVQGLVSTGLWQVVGADLAGPYGKHSPDSGEVDHYLLLVHDHVSGFTCARVLRDSLPKTIALAFHSIFCEHGSPRVLLTDQDRVHFIRKDVKVVLAKHGVKYYTLPGYAQFLSFWERPHKDFVEVTKAIRSSRTSEEREESYVSDYLLAVRAYNATPRLWANLSPGGD
ncbi:hypothetical protein FOL47_011029 [Perkinsus chesapeaki]|uniref:Integrase catalytic domain-containing protein n=1 Tax=Perkinsus chesapeaki TaxID=330153 RepID=A0A7J6KZH0_PERCH|nr:hypothetical protein FOL47_011029 [Perkinsus chesapeaki]